MTKDSWGTAYSDPPLLDSRVPRRVHAACAGDRIGNLSPSLAEPTWSLLTAIDTFLLCRLNS